LPARSRSTARLDARRCDRTDVRPDISHSGTTRSTPIKPWMPRSSRSRGASAIYSRLSRVLAW